MDSIKYVTEWWNLFCGSVCGVLVALYIRRMNICNVEESHWEKHTGIVETVHINGNDNNVTVLARVDQGGVVRGITVPWPHGVHVGESVEIHHNLVSGQWDATGLQPTTSRTCGQTTFASYTLFIWFLILVMLDAFYMLRGIKAK